MRTIKVKECECGEDIYEDDKGSDTESGMVECINCGVQYPLSDLQEEIMPEIKEIKEEE